VLFDGSTGAVRTLVASHPEAEQLTAIGAANSPGHRLGGHSGRPGTAIEDLSQSVRSGLAEAAQRVGLPVTAVVALHGPRRSSSAACSCTAARWTPWPAGCSASWAPLADVLGSVLGNLEAYRHSASLVARLTNALDRQGPIEQAKGMLSERHGVDLDAAYRMLRDEAHRQATAVVRSPPSWSTSPGESPAARP